MTATSPTPPADSDWNGCPDIGCCNRRWRRVGDFFDSLLEPGPPAVATNDRIVLISNGANLYEHGDPNLPAFAYQPGQVLFDPQDEALSIPVDEKFLGGLILTS